MNGDTLQPAAVLYQLPIHLRVLNILHLRNAACDSNVLNAGVGFQYDDRKYLPHAETILLILYGKAAKPKKSIIKAIGFYPYGCCLVEISGIKPLTSSMPFTRSTKPATQPSVLLRFESSHLHLKNRYP